MKHFSTLLLLLLFLPMAAFAQSMSDNQVMELIKREVSISTRYAVSVPSTRSSSAAVDSVVLPMRPPAS